MLVAGDKRERFTIERFFTKNRFLSTEMEAAVLEWLKDLYLFDFGIFIEIAPDAQEKADLEANIQQALNKENIDLEDAIEIRQIKNIKLANELLKVKRKRKQERVQREELTRQQMQAQMNMQSQQAAAQAAMQKMQMESQIKISVENAKADGRIRELQAEAMLKKELMYEEFVYGMQLKGVEVGGKKAVDQMKEDRKDQRVDKQSTQQSKLIEQRQQNKPPVDFESNNDTFDGINMGEIGP